MLHRACRTGRRDMCSGEEEEISDEEKPEIIVNSGQQKTEDWTFLAASVLLVPNSTISILSPHVEN